MDVAELHDLAGRNGSGLCGDATMLRDRALAFALAGQPSKGIELLRKMDSAEKNDGEMVYKMAQAFAQLGDKESSLRLWRRSIELNFYPYPYFLRDPLLDPLRGEPQYAAVLELARQRHEAFQRKYF